MGLELVSLEKSLNKSEVERLQEIVKGFRLRDSYYTKHNKHKEVRSLMASNPGRFVQFDSKKVDAGIVLSINRMAFVSGCRLAYMSRTSNKSWGTTNRYVVDITKQPEEKLPIIYGGEAFTEMVKAVLTLEKNGINVPKFTQEKLVFSKEKPDRNHLTGEEISTLDQQESEPVVEVPIVEEVVQTSSSVKIENSDFDAIRETVKSMYISGLLNEKIKSEVNGMILEKLFTMDFVEEILNNRF